MQPVPRGVYSVFLVRLLDGLALAPCLLPANAAAPRHAQVGVVNRPRTASVRKRRSIAMVLGGLATIGLLNICGCAGGWQGSKPVAPTTITQPENQTVTVGQIATFNVVATGTGPFSYQWYKDGVAISGATSSTYTTPATVTADSGSAYTVTVSNAAGEATSVAATLTVKRSTPIAASLVPSPSTPPYKGSVTLVPTFSGGTAVIGSTGVGSSDITAAASSGGSYPTPALTSSRTYTLTVTSPKGNVVSTTCVVTPTSVTISPITPANQTFAPGLVNFTAIASGGGTNQLTWSASGGSFSGNVWTSPAALATYTITATSVDNPSVSVSTNATLSAPVIQTQPVGQSVCTDGGLALIVSANYATSYQWKLNGSPIPGATGYSYTVSHTTSANAGNYTVTVTNPAGSVTSSVVAVVVASITSNPMSLSIYTTQTATFSVAATGQSPFSYQWYQVPSGGTTGVAIPGATSSVYTTPATDASYNGAKYFATVKDSCGAPIGSNSATLTVTTGNVPPTITTQPVSQRVVIGGTTSLTVVASGSPTLIYQWYRVSAGQATGVSIAGATFGTYIVPSSATTASNDQDSYYVVVSNPYGQSVSQRATLAVGNGILITSQPATAYVNQGAPATFQVSANSDLPLTYQWYRADPGSSTFTPIAGATNSTYTLDPTATADSGSIFHVVVSNGTTSVTSNSAGLFVGPLGGIDDLCSTTWAPQGNAISGSGCSFQLTAAVKNQHGEVVWPNLISTGDIQLSFTVAISNPSTLPADGFTVVLGDPSLGATPASTGATGMGLGAKGIPGFVLAFDTYLNVGDPKVPYVAIGRGEASLWEKPWLDVNTSIPPLAAQSSTVSHSYTVSLVQGQMSVTMDGLQILSESVTVPPVAYLYVTASTGGSYEQTVISNVSASVSAPSQ
jgi:Immunoglobulin I-set domain